MLMLGAGGSGKTTFRKQIQRIYANSFASEAERKEQADIIVGNLLEGARAIITASFERGIGGGISAEESLAAASHINSLDLDGTKILTPETARALQILWNDPNFQSAIDHRSRFQLQGK